MESNPNQSLISSMKTDITIDLTELTAIFVADLEGKLYEQKDKLTNLINETKKELTDLEKAVKEKADFSEFLEGGFPNLGVAAKLTDDPVIDWRNGSVNRNISLYTEQDKSNRGYRDNSIYRFNKEKEVSFEDKEAYKEIQEAIKKLNEDLRNILLQLGDLPRKERQVRARISKMKLEQSGQMNILKDEELLKLMAIN